jgi:hypothetical protein
MAPSHSKQSPKAEGKKVVAISAGVQKKKKEAPTQKYILLRAMRQNVGIETEIIVGWGLDQSNSKEIFVIWYLATLTSANVAVLTAPTGYGKPKAYPPSTIKRKELAAGHYVEISPTQGWASTMMKPATQL